MFVRRAALEQVGPLDEGYFLHCEDLDWCMRFRQAGWKIMFVPDVAVIHFKGQSSKARPIRVLWHKHKGMIRFYQKFFRREYSWALMVLVAIAVWTRFSLLALVELLGRARATKESSVTPAMPAIAPTKVVRGNSRPFDA